MFKWLLTSDAGLSIAGFLLALHYRFVSWTNRVVRIPSLSFYDPLEREPVIIALWHGEHFLIPFFGWRQNRITSLVTLHRDGEILVRAGQRFGCKYIRGSGDNGREFVRKKALRAFRGMLRLIKSGESIVMTADVPKIARVAGLGIVTLAQYSGRPIIPLGMGTSRRYRLSNWDRSCIGLPFGRMVMVRGEPIRVARDADDAALELARRQVEERLDEVTVLAYAAADGPGTLRAPAFSISDLERARGGLCAARQPNASSSDTITQSRQA
jgi:lysophospholipid acyltransferase (LPLAT)-like uncharacterized protein